MKTKIENYKVIKYDQGRVIARVVHTGSGKMYDMTVKVNGINKKTYGFAKDLLERKGFEVLSIKPILL